MNWDDRKLLERWARLQLLIAIARTERGDGPTMEHNVGRVDRVDSSNMLKSTGWRALRNWWHKLSRLAQRNARVWMRRDVEGVEKLKRAIEAQGETFDYADLEFNLKIDSRDGTRVDGPAFKGSPLGEPEQKEQST